MSKSEYRIRWRREGKGAATQIYQTRTAAERKIRGILALEEVKRDTSMRDMAALVERPILEQRAVEAWEPTEAAIEPTDKDREGMRAYFGCPDDDGYGPF